MRFTIEHLSKHFENKEVLHDIDFTFESGKIYGLLGRNGAGKTTLFNCLNRDMKADGGSFCLETEGQRKDIVPEDIGYVLSTPTVPEFLKIIQSRSNTAPCRPHHFFLTNCIWLYKNSIYDSLISSPAAIISLQRLTVFWTAVSLTYSSCINSLYSLILFVYGFISSPPDIPTIVSSPC